MRKNNTQNIVDEEAALARVVKEGNGAVSFTLSREWRLGEWLALLTHLGRVPNVHALVISSGSDEVACRRPR